MTLIVYFSATGNTANLAKKISKITNGEIYEIKTKSALHRQRSGLVG